MQKSKTVSFTAMVLLVGLIGLQVAHGLTASNGWGVSTGDVLYYTITDARDGTSDTMYAKYEVTETSAAGGSITVQGNPVTAAYVKVNAYLYQGGWTAIASQTDYVLVAVYDQNDGWTGAMSIMYYQPSPAPAPVNMGYIEGNVTDQLAWLQAAGSGLWGASTVATSGSTLTITNATDQLTMAYNATTGVCTEFTHARGSTTMFSAIYSATDPSSTGGNGGGDIPGFPVTIVALACLPAILLAWKRKRA